MRPVEASADDARQMVRELWAFLGNERRVAAMLGCSGRLIRDWLSGRRNPSRTARRAIWLVWAMLLHPERLRSVGDLLTWGRVSEAHERERSTCQHSGWDFEI